MCAKFGLNQLPALLFIKGNHYFEYAGLADSASIDFFLKRTKRLKASSGIKCIEKIDGEYNVSVDKPEGQSMKNTLLAMLCVILAAAGLAMIFVLIKACRHKSTIGQELSPLVTEANCEIISIGSHTA